MRVAVVFCGIARGTRITLDSIRQNIYEYNRQRGVSFYTIASLNLIERIDNLRTGEDGAVIDPHEFLALEADSYVLVRQDDAHIADSLSSVYRQADVYDNDWVSIRNSLHQLQSLQRGWALCAQLPEQKFDYYLFLRPDLSYLDPIDIVDSIRKFRGRGSIALPPWHSWGGFNDCFALADPVAARHYANRIEAVRAYCQSNSMHPEMLLAYALRKGRCKVGALAGRAQRVRANGVIKDEDFDASVTQLPDCPETFSYVGRVRFHSHLIRRLQIPYVLDGVRFLKSARRSWRGR